MSASAVRPPAVDAFERAVVLSEALAAVTRVRESLEEAGTKLAAADEGVTSDYVNYLVGALDTARSAAGGLVEELAGMLSDARAELRTHSPG